jgi:hypothetical protein
MKTLLMSLALISLTVACGNGRISNNSTIASSNPTTVKGVALVRIVSQHNYINVQLKGDDIVLSLYKHLAKLKAVTEGDDGDYSTYKRSKEISCGGTSHSSEEPVAFEDPSCIINFSRDGKAGVVDRDVYSWSNAPIKTREIPVTVSFKNDVASVLIHPSVDSHILFEQFTGLTPKRDSKEDTIHKVGPNIQIDHEYGDGDDYFARFDVNDKGQLSVNK